MNNSYSPLSSSTAMSHQITQLKITNILIFKVNECSPVHYW